MRVLLRVVSIWRLLFFILATTGYGQEYSYTQYTTKEGLAGDVVNYMLQDRNGFIWFSTETGLSRFDGKQFKNFTEKDGLPSNEILACFIDSKDRIWIGAFGSVPSYYWKGKIYNPSNDPVLKKVTLAKEIRKVVEDDQKNIFIWGRDRSGAIIRPDGSVGKLYNKNSEQLFVANKPDPMNGIPSLLLKVPPAVKVLLERDKIILDEDKFFDHVGATYLLQNGPLNNKSRYYQVIDTIKNTLRHYSRMPNVRMQAMLNDSILAQTFFTRGARLFHYKTGKVVAHFLPEYDVNYFFEDKEKNMWFSTSNAGIFKLGYTRMTLYTFPDQKLSLPVVTLKKVGSYIYAADQEDGLWQLSPVGSGKQTNPAFTKTKVKRNSLWFMRHLKEEFIYCSNSAFIGKIVGSSLKSAYLFNDTVLVSSGNWAEFRDLEGRHLAFVYPERTTCAIRYDGDYFLGTLNELVILDRSGKVKARPIKGRISYFANNADGSLWIATYNAGVYLWKNGRVIDSINQSNSALNSNNCRCLFTNGNTLWIGTDKGANKLRISDKTVVANYTTYDGLGSDIVNAIFAEDSLVMIGTQKGLNCFIEPSSPRRWICNLQITDILVSGVQQPLDSPLLLPHKDNTIRFDYSGISFSGGIIRFRYRIPGFIDKWQETSEQTVTFPSMGSGQYKFQLMAISQLGDTTPIIEKEFEIMERWDENRWFRLGMIMLLALLLALVVRTRVKHVQRREKAKQQTEFRMLELEQMALRAQMNPHFIFNCLNSIQKYILRQDARGANFYLAQFAGLIRMTLDNAPKKNIFLSEEIEYLSAYLHLEQLQSASSFRYLIEVAEGIDPHSLEIPNMVLQPYVENAIKHALGDQQGNLLEIQFRLAAGNRILECSIRDNGPGINKTAQAASDRTHHPKGLGITSQRIDLLNKMSSKHTIAITVEDLSIYNKTGTLVVIQFPLKDQA